MQQTIRYTLRSLFVYLLIINPLATHAQLVINELMAANAGAHLDRDFYNFSDWLELYNQGEESMNLGDYFLSDDATILDKWKLPSTPIGANSYMVIWCDKEESEGHASFGISAEGEEIFLSDGSGNIIDRVLFVQQYPNISLGRDPADPDSFLYCIAPSPGTANAISIATEPGPEVDFSVPAGRVDAGFSLHLEGGEIRFTNEGSDPLQNSRAYTDPVPVNRTMVVKAKTFREGFLPSQTKAASYFVNEHRFTLPVVSLSFDPEYFYDNMIGIHVRGINGSTGNCGSVANWNQNWERPGYFEYFDADGICRISQPAGLKIGGGCTRGRDQKSLSIYARDKYGDDDFDYTFFREKPDISSFSSLLLRNSGNDQDQTLLRDAFLQALVKPAMDIDAQSYQPAIVYFNGEYRGIMNLREKTDEDYFQGNYFIPDDEIDYLEKDRQVIRGSDEDFSTLMDFLTHNSLAEESAYRQVAQRIDVQEFINWLTVHLYIANRDWPGNNLKFWKTRENGQWRWMLFDLDYGFGFRMDEDGYTHKTFDFATATDGPDHPNPPWSTLLFRRMLENGEFRKQFLSTFLTHVYSSFEPEWCHTVLDSLSNIIDYEIYFNQQKYDRSKGQWRGYLDQLSTYAVKRHAFMPAYVKTFFGLNSEEVQLHISNPDPGKGKVRVNQALIQHYPLELETYQELPLCLEAVPEKGHRFLYWRETGSENIYSAKTSLHYDNTPAIGLEAVWEPIPAGGQIHINEIAAVNSFFRDEYDERSGFIELYNPSAEEAILWSWFLSDDPERPGRYAIPDSTIIPADGFLLVYADGEARQDSLHTPFRLDPDGERLYLHQKVGKDFLPVDSVSFSLLDEGRSYGRFEDGTGPWNHMARITPGLPNDPHALYDPPVTPVSRDLFRLYPNPAAEQLFIMLEDESGGTERYFVEVIDMSGRKALPPSWLNSSPAMLNTSCLSEGLYIVHIFSDRGSIQRERLVISR